jgi:hypothetical protein
VHKGYFKSKCNLHSLDCLTLLRKQMISHPMKLNMQMTCQNLGDVAA